MGVIALTSLVVVILQHRAYEQERSDLLDRIMAADWYQYQARGTTPKSRSFLRLNREGKPEGGE